MTVSSYPPPVAAQRFPAVLPAPAVGSAGVAAFRREPAVADVEVASVLPLHRWSGPDEDQRQAAVRLRLAGPGPRVGRFNQDQVRQYAGKYPSRPVSG
jgi:hypothetical protein